MNGRTDLPTVLGRLGAKPITVRVASLQGVSIQCHENDIPLFAEAELERLYGNIFASLPHCRVFGHARHASTYVVHDGKEIVTLWLFRRMGSVVQVLNEGIAVTEGEAKCFAEYVFTTYPEVTLISFHAVQAQIGRLSYPFQSFNCLEDMVVALPHSIADYKATLGKSTRAYINRYLNKLKRDFPSFHFDISTAPAINEAAVQELIELNRVRMALKGRVSINDEETSARIMELAAARGMVCVIKLDGDIRAGTINYQATDNYFLEVVAHDPAFNDYRLGTLACYLTVCECISRGGQEYHMLWGQDEYKHRLLAKQRDLDHVAIFRSHAAMLMHSDMLLKNACSSGSRRARLWLRNARHEQSFAAQLAEVALRSLRNFRDFRK